MIHHSESPRHEMTSGEAGVVGAVLGFGLVALALYLAIARYHIRKEQLVEAGLYVFIVTAAIVGPVLRKFVTTGTRKKRPPFVIPARKDERAIEAAWNQNAVLLGYDMDEKPWLWPDEVRVMQGIVLGMTGSGKTTLLKNIITQDIARLVGPPEDRHHIPIVIFDGKGDLEFFEQLLPHIHRAGRLHQLRLLNPSRPEFSALYNPFFTRDDNYMAQVNMIFGSFNLHDEFFAKHQLNYLGDIVRVLFYTGARYNFYDVIVMLLDQDVLKEQIEKAMHRLDRDGGITAQQRLNFEMSVKNLMQSLEDRERVPKIQGLINECMTFLDDELSAVTGQYDDLLSIEDVIDQELILFVSLNANKNTEPVRSLGKMLLQNIQLTVGKRYEDQADRRRQNRPIFSVVLDEFAPFGYRNFAQILQTARGTNTAFLFSMQSLPQLMQVGRGFKEEVTSAPNTTITLRTRDEETAKYFIKASAEQVVTRRSIQKERGFFGWGKYEETGRATESEDRETRSQDESIKNLPKGQMEILMSDDTRGTLHSLLQIRPPEEVAVPGFQPALYPRICTRARNRVAPTSDSKTRNWRASFASRIVTQETFANDNPGCSHPCSVRGNRSRPDCIQSGAERRNEAARGGTVSAAGQCRGGPGERRLPHLVHQTCQQERRRLWRHARTAPPGVSGRQRRQPVLLVQCADHGDSDGADVRLRCARYGRETKTLARRRNPERCLERCTVRPRDSGRRDRAAQRAHGDVQPGDRGADKRAPQPRRS